MFPMLIATAMTLAACDPELVGDRCETDADCQDPDKVCAFDTGRCVPLSDIGFGGRVAYVSDRSGAFEVWVMNDDGTCRRRVTDGAERPEANWGAHHPRWSPDGASIAFYYGCYTDRVDDPPATRFMRAGPAGFGQEQLSDHGYANGTQLTWSRDGAALLLSMHRPCDDYIERVEIAGGARSILVEDTEDGYPCAKSPDVNPADPDLVALVAYACGGDYGGIRVHDLADDHDTTPAGPGSPALSPRWSPDGQLLAWAETNGRSIHLADNLGDDREEISPCLPGDESALDGPDWADGGFVFTVVQGPESAMWICDRDGNRARPVLDDQQRNFQPDWAPGRLPDMGREECEAHGGRWDRDGREGYGCWVLSALDQSCTGACDDHGLMCDPGDWNDTPACDLCRILTGEPKSTANNPDHGNGAPCLYVPPGSSHGCYYRADDFHQDCDASGGDRIRLCVCRPWD